MMHAVLGNSPIDEYTSTNINIGKRPSQRARTNSANPMVKLDCAVQRTRRVLKMIYYCRIYLPLGMIPRQVAYVLEDVPFRVALSWAMGCYVYRQHGSG